MNDDRYDVRVFFKPNAKFRDVTGDIENVTKSLTNRDYVICIGGSNDVEETKPMDTDALEKSIKCCTHTNLILTTVLFRFDEMRYLNDRIYKLNNKIRDLAYLQNVPVIDVNAQQTRRNYTYHGLHLNRHGKKRLVHQIIQKISSLEKNASVNVVKNTNVSRENINDSETNINNNPKLDSSNECNKSVSQLVQGYEDKTASLCNKRDSFLLRNRCKQVNLK